MEAPAGMDVAVFACGCFWGAEKGFWRLPGVYGTDAGYAGGSDLSPSYEKVCTGNTGHAEAVRVVFDPCIIAFADLLRWFWQFHDPTQADGQGNDRGGQYRSAIFYTSAEQLQAIQATRSAYQCMLRANGVDRQIVTEVKPLGGFFRAEPAHQQYLAQPGARPYCSARPLMLRSSEDDWRQANLLLTPELRPRLSESFWRIHAPTYHCALTLPNEPIVWDDVPWLALSEALCKSLERDDRSGPPDAVAGPAKGSEELMASKAHGTCERGAQRQLRWGCDHALADRICCFNRRFAEPHGYWHSTRLQQMHVSAKLSASACLITFFDSVDGLPCYQIGALGRSWGEFERESRAHGWPSFRDGEVDWQHVRLLQDGEVVTVKGAHLGHNLPDELGNRYCINLVSIAGRPMAPYAAAAASEAAAFFAEPIASEAEATSDETYDGPWSDLPPVAIVPLSGDATVVGHEHHCVADSIADVVKGRLGPRALVVKDWHAEVDASAVLFIIEVERDGTACDAARKFLRQLSKSSETVFGQTELRHKAIGVLGLARSVCSFSAASGGADKFAGAARFQRRLATMGCHVLLPMGMSEVELEAVDVAVLPWVDAAARAFEELIHSRVMALGMDKLAADAEEKRMAEKVQAAVQAETAQVAVQAEKAEKAEKAKARQSSGRMWLVGARSSKAILAALLGAGSFMLWMRLRPGQGTSRGR